MEAMNLQDQIKAKRLLQGLNIFTQKTLDTTTGTIFPNSYSFLLILEGYAEVCIDFTFHTLPAGSLVVVAPVQRLELLSMSSDIRFYGLSVSTDYMARLETGGTIPIHLSVWEVLQKNTCLLKQEDIIRLTNSVQSIDRKLRLNFHFFQNEIILNSLAAFLLDLANITYICKVHAGVCLSYGETMVDHFLYLLFRHFKEEHSVTYYAEKLSVTSQYLSLLLKKYTGRPTLKWIQYALLSEARVLLIKGVNLQDIADALHFDDTSNFGHFFKKHLGISPLKYKQLTI